MPGERAFRRGVAEGDAARDRRDWPAAIAAYRRARTARPGRVWVCVQLGHALREAGDLDTAEAQYRAFLAQRPQDADIHLQLGRLLRQRGEWSPALAHLDRARALSRAGSPLRADIEQAAAEVAAARTRDAAQQARAAWRWDDARTILAVAVEQQGQDDLLPDLTIACKEAGDLDAADRYCRRWRGRARSATDRAEAAAQSGHVSKLRGDHAAALSHYISADRISADRALGATASVSPDEQDATRRAAVRREIDHCRRLLSPVLLVLPD